MRKKSDRRVINFSQYFSLGKTQFELDFVDVPVVNRADLPLFIDPYAISLRTDQWSVSCHNLIINFFQRVVDLIRSKKPDEAYYMLSNLREPNQTRFGLSQGNVPRGKGVSGLQARQLLEKLISSSAVRTGFLKTLEECELLVEGIGRDKISDITTNIIKQSLINYTKEQCNLFNIKLYEVSCGFIWSKTENKWISEYHNLPICDKNVILLVPKCIARFDLEFSSSEYYNQFVVPFLQAEEFRADTSLVRTLKNGEKKPPSKKSIKNKFPLRKEYLYKFSKENIQVFDRYKRKKRNEVILEINNEDLSRFNDEMKFNYQDKIHQLKKIKTGNEQASEYHNFMIGVLEVIFYPYLIQPKKEQEVNQGRKRIDIVFTNNNKGFFSKIAVVSKIVCPYIMMECKNYSEDPKNPELDQLSGRLNSKRGEIGFLICRNIKNKKLLYKRCKDLVNEDKGYIIPLDDNDIIELVNYKENKNEESIRIFLDDRYKNLVM